MKKTRKDKIKVVSGGQSGVDRAALDAALQAGVACGGWCPQGRMAEDGPIPARYPLLELEGGGYRQRTLRNLEDSDGTLIICFGPPSGGTELTLRGCIDRDRPYLLIDAEETTSERAIERVRSFLAEREIEILNVAGPRASGDKRAYDYAFAVILGLLFDSGQGHGIR